MALTVNGRQNGRFFGIILESIGEHEYFDLIVINRRNAFFMIITQADKNFF